MPRYEAPRHGWFVEVERDGVTVRTCRGTAEHHRTKEATFETVDDARFAYGNAVREARVGTGTRAAAGPSQILGGAPREVPGSTVLADEYFATSDDRFLGELLRVAAAGTLGALAPKWFADPRPWARAQLLAYIDDGCDRPEHKALVKRLFKAAETAGDDEAMAHFLVAFDAMGTRLFAKPRRWSRQRELVQDTALTERLGDPKAERHPQFTRATRRYLARRAYRYFRMLGHRDVARYGRAVRGALRRYRDERLETGARLLDAWGLVHALYAWSPVIVREPRGIYLAKGRALGELAPAPHFPAAWQGVFDELFDLLVGAPSRVVRTWTAAWLRAHYAAELAKLPFAAVKRLLLSPHEELQALGGAALPTLGAALDVLPIGEWLELLASPNLDLLTIIVQVVEQHVAPARLSLAQCVALACAQAAPVARLGLAWARAKQIGGAEDLRAIARVAKAGVPSVRAEGTAWAAQTIAAHPAATPEALRDLCDAPHADAREQALATVATTERLATPALWFALTESPYDDVRAVVIANAAKWRAEAQPQTLRHVWASALCAVHRGATAKRRVPKEIAARIAAHPDEARDLLPLLALALRSVRGPERLSALSAIATLGRAAGEDAALRALVHELIPELIITEQVA